MKKRIIFVLYGFLLRLYPRSFRDEFEEQMLLDFSDMVDDASREGAYSLIRFCGRELIAFPVNFLKVYWMEWQMSRVFNLQPLNFALRGAIGFGLTYVLTFPLIKFLYEKMAFIDSIVDRLQVSYYDRYHVERSFELISRIPYLLSLVITGLLLGSLFAFLFAERSQYSRYIAVGTLGWILLNVMGWALSFNFYVFLEERQLIYFDYMTFVLSGAMWGWMLVIARSGRHDAVRWLAVSMFVYPLFAYLWVKGLFNLFVFQTPLRFVGLIILMLILIASVFVLTQKLDSQRKFPWIIVASILGYLAVRPLVFVIGRLIYPPMVALDTALDSLSITVSNVIYGALLGSFLGLIMGFQQKNDTQQATA